FCRRLLLFILLLYFFFLLRRRPPRSTLFPYTMLFRSYVLVSAFDPFAGNGRIYVFVIFRIKSESAFFERFPRRLLWRSVFSRLFYSRLAFSAGTAVRLTFAHKAAFTYSPFRSIRTENADRSAIVFIPFQWRISFRSQRREKFRLHFRPSLLCDAFFALAAKNVICKHLYNMPFRTFNLHPRFCRRHIPANMRPSRLFYRQSLPEIFIIPYSFRHSPSLLSPYIEAVRAPFWDIKAEKAVKRPPDPKRVIRKSPIKPQ